MNKETAKELLKNQKKQLKDNLKKFKDAEANLDEDRPEADTLGPRDELEYQRMIKDIKESNKDEK